MKEIINVTDITAYLYCPRKLYIKKILKVKEPFTKAMLLGKLKHDIFDLFNKSEHILVSGIAEKTDKETISNLYQNLLRKITLEVFQKNWKLTEAYKINKNEFYQEFIEQIKEDINLRISSILENQEKYLGKELWRNLLPKYLTEFQIESSALGLKGRVDRIKFSDKITPYEIKTREEIFEADKLQLAAYILLVEEEFGDKISNGIIKTKKGEEEITMDEGLRDKVLFLIEKVREIENNKPEILSNFKKCSRCPFKEKCLEI